MSNTILITGCTKGIGLALVHRFAKEGFFVAGCARNQEDLTSLFTQLSTQYPSQQFFFENCDVANKEELKQFAKDVILEFGHVDVLVNNAGVFIPGQIYTELEGIFEQTMHTNVNSAYYLSRAIIPTMLERGVGHIFNMCSTASITAYTNGGSYCISKYAMLGLNQVLRQELKDKNIKVTAILPGATLTDSWAGTDLPEERFMPAEDVAIMVWSAFQLSSHTNIEQILMRPTLGDI